MLTYLVHLQDQAFVRHERFRLQHSSEWGQRELALYAQPSQRIWDSQHSQFISPLPLFPSRQLCSESKSPNLWFSSALRSSTETTVLLMVSQLEKLLHSPKGLLERTFSRASFNKSKKELSLPVGHYLRAHLCLRG